MLYVGMDVHKDSTVFCLFDPMAEPQHQYRTLTAPTTRGGIESVLRPLNGRCKAAFEVGVQSQWLASIVRPLAAEVQVANASRIPWLFRDGRKNDQLDARKLATLLRLDQLPRVHLPRAEVSMWRAMINHRRRLIGRRTALKCQVRAILRTFACRCPHKSLWTRKGLSWLNEQVFDEGRSMMMQLLRTELNCIEVHLQQLEEQLDRMTAGHPGVALLRTIPGIGPRCAEAVVAFADDIRRFARGR